MKAVTSFLIYSFLAISCFATSDSTGVRKENLVGLNLGFTTGMGPTFRHWHNKIGIQATAFAFRVGEDWSDQSGAGRFYANFTSLEVDPFFVYEDDDYYEEDYYYEDEYYYEDDYNDRNTLTPGTFISLGLTPMLKIKENKYYNMYTYWGNHLFLNGDYTLYNSGIGIGFELKTIVTPSFMVGYQCNDILGEFNLFPTGEIGLLVRLNDK